MNGREQASEQIVDFLNSAEKCMLITGTNQYKKHTIVMQIIEKLYKNARVLFRINSMQNINNPSFTLLKKVPKVGELIQMGKNFYEFDTLSKSNTWHVTSSSFHFAILYPIDDLCRDKKWEAIDNLFHDKNITKIFLCSWTDNVTDDYLMLENFYARHVIYDAEEENIEYHKRVLESIRRN